MVTFCIRGSYLIENSFFLFIMFAQLTIDGGTGVVLGVPVGGGWDGIGMTVQLLRSSSKSFFCIFSAKAMALAVHIHGLSASPIAATPFNINWSNMFSSSVFNRFRCKCNSFNEPLIRSKAVAVMAAIWQSINFKVCTTVNATRFFSDNTSLLICAHSK